jgi:hypothetical protein
MEVRSELRKQSRSGKRKWAILVGIVALTHILLLLSYGDALRYLLPDGRRLKLPNENNALLMTPSRNTLAVNVSEDSAVSGIHVLEKNGYVSGFGLRNESEDDEGFVGNVDFESFEDVKDSIIIKEVAGSSDNLFPSETTVMQKESVSTSNNGYQVQNVTVQSQKNVKSSILSGGSSIASPASGNSSLLVSKKVSKKKKMRCDLPPKSVTTIDEMNRILARHRRTSRAMRPRWSSRRDEEILTARKEIENAPVAKLERELYPPIFRNVSLFKSYVPQELRTYGTDTQSLRI